MVLQVRGSGILIRKLLHAAGPHVLIYLTLFIALFPFFWMVLASFQHNVDILNVQKGLFRFMPTFKNYDTVFGKFHFITPIRNSLYVATLSTGFALLLGLPAAYSVARYKFRKLSLVVLVVRMIPGITFLVPWYMLFLRLKLTNTFTALVLTHMLIALPFIVWIMTPFFENLPSALEDAAWVDGSSKTGAFFRIVLRVSVPGIISASMLAFIFPGITLCFPSSSAARKP